MERLLNSLGIEKGANTKAFLSGLAVIGPFFLFSKILTFGLQAIASRFLGPIEYGTVNIVIAVSGILIIPLQLGFPVVVTKFTAIEDSHNKQQTVISSVLWLQMIWAVPCAGFLYLIRQPIINIFKITEQVYIWSILFAFFTTVNMFIFSSLQGLKLFYERGKSEFVYALITAIVFVYLYFVVFASFHSYIVAVMVGLVITSIIATYRLRSWIKPVINFSSIFSEKAYTFAPIVNNCVGTILATASPLLVAYYLSVSDVGVFGVYRLSSITIAMTFSSIISIVLFPMTSSPSLQVGAWKKYFKVSIPIFFIGFICFMLSEFVVLKLVGEEYPVKLLWILLFSISATFSLLFGMGLTLLYSKDSTGQWIGVMGNTLAGITSLGMGFLLVPKYGLTGAVTALVISYGAGTIWCFWWGWKKVI